MNAPSFSLLRVAVRDEGVFGVLKQHAGPDDREGTPFAATLERSYILGDTTVIGVQLHGQLVKIPDGRWRCSRTRFFRGGYSTYEIHVPEHSRLLFHRGNVEPDSEGCILVAEKFGVLRAAPAVLESAEGFAEFMSRAAERPEFHLEVRTA